MLMQPFPQYQRRLYLAVFGLLFSILLPIVIMYADGWRYKSGDGFVRTGGVYVSIPYADAHLYVNGAHVGRSGFLERNFYVDDLTPSSYIVRVERSGYRPWTRVLVVDEQLVTDARAILIPTELATVRLVVATSTSSINSTTTRTISSAVSSAYAAAFAATTTASSTIPVDEANGIGIFIDRGVLYARWIRDNAFPPSPFCEKPTSCVNEIVIDDEEVVTAARFFAGGVAYATKDGEVYYKEIDIRREPVSALLTTLRSADIRVIDDSLIVKSGNNLFEISL
jgi:hypothetical protein